MLATAAVNPAPAGPRPTSAAIRQRIRAGLFSGHTSGLAPRHVQGNVVILPADEAHDFLLFCQRNPKPCPAACRLRARRAAAAHAWRRYRYPNRRSALPHLARWSARRRTDANRQLLAQRPGHLCHRLLILLRAGACSTPASRCGTSNVGPTSPCIALAVATQPAGRFHGPLVVSMRPFTPANAIRAVQITARFGAVHGAPVHLGKPELIGIDRPGAARLWRRQWRGG